MKAITTRYLSATNFKGARVVATADPKHRVCVNWDDDLSDEMNHREAARKLAQKLDWHGVMVTGHNHKTQVHVFVSHKGLVNYQAGQFEV